MPSRYDLSGQTAVISGAGRGLGRGCALLLAERGAHVVAVSRTEDELTDLCGRIKSGGGTAQYRQVDVTDIEAFRSTMEGLGPIDIFVNNAGTNIPQPFIEVAADVFDRVVGLNFRAAYFAAQSAARSMVRQRSGTIIHISSQLGHVGAPNRTVYCATKHAIEGLTKAMALELGPLGIRVNSVGPTFVETPMTRPFFADEAFRGEVLGNIPMGQLASIEDVAEAVCYLASPAAGMVNGHCLLVDGGWTAR